MGFFCGPHTHLHSLHAITHSRTRILCATRLSRMTCIGMGVAAAKWKTITDAYCKHTLTRAMHANDIAIETTRKNASNMYHLIQFPVFAVRSAHRSVSCRCVASSCTMDEYGELHFERCTRYLSFHLARPLYPSSSCWLYPVRVYVCD